jgi:hypothetical protein
MSLISNARGSGLTAQPCSTAESSKYCFSQYWNGTIPMSQWGCANSPFTQTVESTFVGQALVTGSGSKTASESGSVATSSTGSGSTASTTSGLSTFEIVGIAFGSFIGLVLILGFLKSIIFPAPPTNPKQSQHPNNSSSENIQLGPTNHGHPGGPLPPQGPNITYNIYGQPTPPPLNNASPPRGYFNYSPHALSQENMDRFQSQNSVGRARTVVSDSECSDVGDLHDFSQSQRGEYGRPPVRSSVISAAPGPAPRVL